MLTIAHDDEIAVITVDNPPVNAIGHELRRGLHDAVALLDADESVFAVILIASGRTFIAGADLSEFGKTSESPHLPDVVARIEQARKPWIVAIHGIALGGGLEVALGCHYRLASHSARLGLPEVTLGVVPGAGGTVRLPRLIGVESAVQMVTTGKPVSAAEAFSSGLVDALVSDDDLRGEAIRFARQVTPRELPVALSARKPLDYPDADFWAQQGNQVQRRARGQSAPLCALACIRHGIEQHTDKAFAFERDTFLELRAGDQATALRHVFFAERAATKPPEIKDVGARSLRNAAVIGGGTMGAGIVAALRDANLPVVLIERDETALERGRTNVSTIFDGAHKRGRIDDSERKSRLAGITFTTDYATLSNVDVVIEAVFEDLGLKLDVFEMLDAACRTDAVLATNTSYLDPNAIASASRFPERVLGLHFFSPANVMKLLEIIPTHATQADVLATGFSLAKALGKIPVQAGVCDGFIGNRILKTTRAQAERMLMIGVTPADVDRAMRRFGMPMGPFEAQDLGGLDIAAFQRSAARERGESPFAPVAERLVALKRLGQKSFAGWYDYSQGDRTPHPSDKVVGIIRDEAAKVGQSPITLTDAELAEHIVFPMINESARILEVGIAKRAADIDLVEIHGYGFPRWRGGLMHYAETVGLTGIVEKLQKMAAAGLSDEPCDLLVKVSGEGRFPC